MSDARCEPPEEYRGRDGWWWVLRRNSLDQEPRRWHAAERAWEIDDGLTDFAGAVCGYSTLTPAEVAALRAERDAARNAEANMAGLCQMAEDDNAVLRARVAVLEGALREALETLGGVLAWHLTPEQYHKHGLRAEDAAAAWSAVRPAVKTARAALTPATAATPASDPQAGATP